MPFPNPATQFKPGQSGAAGRHYKHISTYIQEIMSDENFTLENFLFEGKQWKGAPMKAIIRVGVMNALQGDQKWAEWLAKHGYVAQLDITSMGEKLELPAVYLPQRVIADSVENVTNE